MSDVLLDQPEKLEVFTLPRIFKSPYGPETSTTNMQIWKNVKNILPAYYGRKEKVRSITGLQGHHNS